MKTWTWYKGMYGYAIFNNISKTISHYEDSRIEAIRTCNQWNKEGREF